MIFQLMPKVVLRILFKKYDNIIFLVGGSFLFLNSIIKEFDEMPNIPNELRHKLNHDYQKKGKNTS